MVKGSRKIFWKNPLYAFRNKSLRVMSVLEQFRRRHNYRNPRFPNIYPFYKNAGLLEAVRHGKWTFYRTYEQKIQEVTFYMKDEL